MDIQTRYDTDDVAAQDRVSYWRESVCDSYVQLGCEVENTINFKGLISIARHSLLSISRVAGMAHKVHRRKRDISGATDAFFLLSLQTAESSRVTQFGKTAHLRPGDMTVYSSTDPYRLDLQNDFSQTVIQLPAAKLIDRLPNAEMLTARTIDGQSGIGKLVRENVLAFSEHVNTANPMVQTLLQDTLVDLIATGLASHSAEKIELSSPEQHVMLRAKSFVRANLGDPELDRTLVAREIGMSVRRLNEIFAKDDETISAFIRRLRLEGVAADLRDARFECLSISEIAFKYGFSNVQNFSTLFRAKYSISPRGYRAG
ncbi:MAG: helix-turn-helix domain-containing protein [Paracoccaceae bacterium]|uniref:AraC-like ligand-binding domain-containing protein n=1 Tax=Shimia thalassica TaxID=1715693 RepID=UPI003299E94A